MRPAGNDRNRHLLVILFGIARSCLYHYLQKQGYRGGAAKRGVPFIPGAGIPGADQVGQPAAFVDQPRKGEVGSCGLSPGFADSKKSGYRRSIVT